MELKDPECQVLMDSHQTKEVKVLYKLFATQSVEIYTTEINLSWKICLILSNFAANFGELG